MIKRSNQEEQKAQTVGANRQFVSQIFLPIVLYRYETWCVTLTEKHRFRAFEKRRDLREHNIKR